MEVVSCSCVCHLKIQGLSFLQAFDRNPMAIDSVLQSSSWFPNVPFLAFEEQVAIDYVFSFEIDLFFSCVILSIYIKLICCADHPAPFAVNLFFSSFPSFGLVWISMSLKLGQHWKATMGTSNKAFFNLWIVNVFYLKMGQKDEFVFSIPYALLWRSYRQPPPGRHPKDKLLSTGLHQIQNWNIFF